MIAVLILSAGINALGAQYSVGSGNADWWTGYPDQSPGAGGRVNHPSWVLDSLKEKPVLIYVHGSCDYCQPQTEALEKVADGLVGKVEFYEIGGDGDDVRYNEALNAYDPNGGVMYLSLTAIVTLASFQDGSVEPVWHSSDDITGEEWINSYVEDAIGLYTKNSDKWNV